MVSQFIKFKRALKHYGGYNYANGKQYIKSTVTDYLAENTIGSSDYEILTKNNNTYNLGTDFYLNKKSTVGFMVNGYYNKYHSNETNDASSQAIDNSTNTLSRTTTTGKNSNASPSVNLYYQTTFDSVGNALSLNADYINYTHRANDNCTTDYLNGNMQPLYMRDNSPSVSERVNHYLKEMAA